MPINLNNGVNISFDDWKNYIFTEFYKHMHVVEHKNYDEDYVRIFENYKDNFFVDKHVSYINFFITFANRLYDIRCLLSDDQSKSLMDLLLLFKLLSHHHVRLPLSNEEYFNKRQEYRNNLKIIKPGNDNVLRVGELVFNHDGDDIHLICAEGGPFFSFLSGQYFYDRDGVRVRPETGDHAIDAGACMGDNSLAFAKAVGPDGRVYTFDFMPDHLAIIQKNLEFNESLASRIKVIPVGLSDRANDIPPGQAAAEINVDHIAPWASLAIGNMPMRTIDQLVDDKSIERIDFIKMDIEGAELAALKGGENSIRKFKPKLAISVYHKYEDMILIPLYIMSLGLGYKLYLDHYTVYQDETVLYAIAD